MKPLRDFKEYVRSRVVETRPTNTERVHSLEAESAHRAAYVDSVCKNLGINESTANYIIESCYDTLIALARARLIEANYYARGEGAHEAEVAFLRTIDVPESDINFLNELRYRRNRILYYGDRYDTVYAHQCQEKLQELRSKLLYTTPGKLKKR